MSAKSSFYNERDIKNNEKHVSWAQHSWQNHHQTFHDRCPEKIGPLPKKSDHWVTRTCPKNIGLASTWWTPSCGVGSQLLPYKKLPGRASKTENQWKNCWLLVNFMPILIFPYLIHVYGICINLLMTKYWMRKSWFFIFPLANATWFVVVRPC